MKKLGLVTASLLAMSVSGANAQDWSGFYIGTYLGVGAQQTRGTDPTGAFTGVTDQIDYGFHGGGTAGFNWQSGNWVAGIEGDFGALNLKDRQDHFNNTPFHDTDTSWLATLRGRIGLSNGPTLFYVTGGAAWADIDAEISFGAPGVSDSKTKTGYALGSGTETMLGGNWTAKSEYLFVDLGKGPTIDNSAIIQSDQRHHLQRFGLNYRFGAPSKQTLNAYNWSGGYIGLVGGSAVAAANAVDPSGGRTGEIGNNGSGYSLGLLAGINWQAAPSWVAGIEGDFSWLGIDRSLNFYETSAVYGLDTSWIATARGRIGYSTGAALLYVTGGGAWVDVRDTYSFGATQSSRKTLSGYVVGGGIDAILGPNWTSKSEYLFVDAGKGNTIDAGGEFLQVQHKFHLFRSALVYRFGG